MARQSKKTAEKPKKEVSTAVEEVTPAVEESPVEEPKMASMDEVAALMARVKELEAALANAQPTTIKVAEETVTVAYMAEVAPTSTLDLKEYGTLRPGSYIEVPKKEFGNKFMTNLVRKLIEKRHLLVLNGLDEDERERWGCNYKAGEILDQRTFDKMLDLSTEKLAEVFEKLCPEHQRFVATRMITAKEKGDNRMSAEKAKRINELSKKNDPEGMLKPVMEAYAEELKA